MFVPREREGCLSTTGLVPSQGHSVLPQQPQCLYNLKVSVNNYTITCDVILYLPLWQLLRSIYRVWMIMHYGNAHAALTCSADIETRLLQPKSLLMNFRVLLVQATGIILCQVRKLCTRTRFCFHDLSFSTQYML